MMDIADHLSRAVRDAHINDTPAPYIFVEDAFPVPVYQEICERFQQSDPALKEQVHKGDPKVFFGSYADRLEARVPADTDALPEKIAKFWSALKSQFESAAFFGALFDKFAFGFRQRFGANADVGKVRPSLRPTLLLTRHRPHYYLGPHTDRFEKVVTCIFNFAERDGLDHLGTMMYAPKQKGFTCNGTLHHNPALFDPLHMVPYRPNSALIFFRDDRLFHGVERLTEADMMGSARRNIQYNLWAK